MHRVGLRLGGDLRLELVLPQVLEIQFKIVKTVKSKNCQFQFKIFQRRQYSHKFLRTICFSEFSRSTNSFALKCPICSIQHLIELSFQNFKSIFKILRFVRYQLIWLKLNSKIYTFITHFSFGSSEKSMKLSFYFTWTVREIDQKSKLFNLLSSTSWIQAINNQLILFH